MQIGKIFVLNVLGLNDTLHVVLDVIQSDSDVVQPIIDTNQWHYDVQQVYELQQVKHTSISIEPASAKPWQIHRANEPQEQNQTHNNEYGCKHWNVKVYAISKPVKYTSHDLDHLQEVEQSRWVDQVQTRHKDIFVRSLSQLRLQ